MAAMLYRCPNTGFRVQGYTVDETIVRDHDAYEPVSCLACKLVHLVNPKSGKVFVAAGGGGEASGAHAVREFSLFAEQFGQVCNVQSSLVSNFAADLRPGSSSK
jgi:hypothetical protein